MKVKSRIFITIFLLLLITISCSEKQYKKTGFIYVDGAKLGYAIEGEGIPCIVPRDRLIVSRALSSNLRKHIQFIFVDSRKDVLHQSGFDVGSVNLNTFINDIEQVRKELNLGKVCIFGHSVWGLLALEYSLIYPHNTSHVIMNATPPGFPDNLDRYIETINKYWEAEASDERKEIFNKKWESLPDDTLNSLSDDNAFILTYVTNGPKYWYDPDYDCTWLLKGRYTNPAYKTFEIMANYKIETDDSESVPIFLSLGKYDFSVPYVHWDSLKTRLNNLSYNLFEKSGHYAMIEEEELYDKTLIDWLNTN